MHLLQDTAMAKLPQNLYTCACCYKVKISQYIQGSAERRETVYPQRDSSSGSAQELYQPEI